MAEVGGACWDFRHLEGSMGSQRLHIQSRLEACWLSHLPRASPNISQRSPVQYDMPGSHPSHRTDSFAGRGGEPGRTESDGDVLLRLVGLEFNRERWNIRSVHHTFGNRGALGGNKWIQQICQIATPTSMPTSRSRSSGFLHAQQWETICSASVKIIVAYPCIAFCIAWVCLWSGPCN